MSQKCDLNSPTHQMCSGSKAIVDWNSLIQFILADEFKQLLIKLLGLEVRVLQRGSVCGSHPEVSNLNLGYCSYFELKTIALQSRGCQINKTNEAKFMLQEKQKAQ